MPILYKKEEGRNYQRYKHTAKEQATIRSKGFEPVVSSNVSAIAREGKILYIRFHDKATYAYPKSGNLYEDMLNSSSKGKFVWDKLIRKNVPYRKAQAKAFSVGSPYEDQAPVNLMEQQRQEKAERSSALLVGLALSTMITADQALKQGTIVSLALANLINSTITQ